MRTRAGECEGVASECHGCQCENQPEPGAMPQSEERVSHACRRGIDSADHLLSGGVKEVNLRCVDGNSTRLADSHSFHAIDSGHKWGRSARQMDECLRS